MKLKKTVLVALGILILIFLFALNVYSGEKAVNRCISSGVSEDICNDLRK
jgi:hypothetical protein